MTNETNLLGKINCIFLASDRKEFVFIRLIGKIFLALINNLNFTLHSTYHSSSVNYISFNKIAKLNDIFNRIYNNDNLN